VRIEDDEVAPIAAHLGLDETEFLERYTRLRTNRTGLSLIEKENHECIMLDGNSCRIHPVKPSQCKGFPNLWNFPGWRDVCEAIPVPVDGHQGRMSP
jgi:Fe-S-cluster containining protein